VARVVPTQSERVGCRAVTNQPIWSLVLSLFGPDELLTRVRPACEAAPGVHPAKISSLRTTRRFLPPWSVEFYFRSSGAFAARGRRLAYQFCVPELLFGQGQPSVGHTEHDPLAFSIIE